MTSEEKKQITQLRKRGCTYQEISQETGLRLITTPAIFSPIRIGNSSRCIRMRASAEPIPDTGKDSMR